jgi:hypothetical protein
MLTQSKTREDVLKSLEILKTLRNMTEYDAVITKTFVEINKDTDNLEDNFKVDDDQYIVDIYTNGATWNPDSEKWEGEVSRPGVTAFPLYFKDSYQIKALVRVSYLDEIAIILPRRLPYGVGRYRSLIIVDDLSPGTPAWDFVRFTLEE